MIPVAGLGSQISTNQQHAVKADYTQQLNNMMTCLPGSRVVTGVAGVQQTSAATVVHPGLTLGTMSAAQLETELEQFIEDTDPALEQERQEVEWVASQLREAVVFKVDGCVITKAEKLWSKQLQVPISTRPSAFTQRERKLT